MKGCLKILSVKNTYLYALSFWRNVTNAVRALRLSHGFIYLELVVEFTSGANEGWWC